jgi:cytochrome d ubiquinol oxidase subunit I
VSSLDLARWQFGITTVYHFIFVPLTLGLSILVAGMQTAWYRTGKAKYKQMTKFWGKLLLINFAMGVVTGIVQEFQFGMNWSEYSRFVGDIFGAPLAIEGLLAFFLESTFLGLWIFGWDRLSPRLHLTTIWAAAIGTNLSAYFILAANSWMQHPVGYEMNPVTGRAELKDFGAVLTNSTVLSAFPHVMTAAFMTAGAFILGIAGYHLYKRQHLESMGASIKVALVTILIAGVGTIITGDSQARIMTEQQPMKMAAAEALWYTSGPASFSAFTIGNLDGTEEVFSVRVPNLLSLMSTGDLNGTVEGMNELQQQYVEKYGAGDYVPNVPVSYWTFRLMMGMGFLAMAIALWGLVMVRRKNLPGRRFYLAASAALYLPFLGNSFGWSFTEIARQPWVVFGVMQTKDGVSTVVPAWSVATTLIGFTVLYAVLAVIEVILMVRYAKAGPMPEEEPTHSNDPDRPLAFAY